MTISHKVLAEHKIHDLTVQQLEQEVEGTISDPKGGYHEYGNAWWSNLTCPYAFQYFKLDGLYPKEYFDSGDHPDYERSEALYSYMQEIYNKIFKRQFVSIIELGGGGGGVTLAFKRHNIDYCVVEGTKAGVEKLLQSGLDPKRVVHQNLKFLGYLGRFDIVLCTEIAEHIEPFFASKVVDDCIKHSDVVWFSSANRHRPAHYHHMNEQDIEVWDNLFAHMGCPYLIKLSGLHARASRLYLRHLPDAP